MTRLSHPANFLVMAEPLQELSIKISKMKQMLFITIAVSKITQINRSVVNKKPLPGLSCPGVVTHEKTAPDGSR